MAARAGVEIDPPVESDRLNQGATTSHRCTDRFIKLRISINPHLIQLPLQEDVSFGASVQPRRFVLSIPALICNGPKNGHSEFRGGRNDKFSGNHQKVHFEIFPGAPQHFRIYVYTADIPSSYYLILCWTASNCPAQYRRCLSFHRWRSPTMSAFSSFVSSDSCPVFLSGVLSSLRMPFFCRYPSFDFPVAVDISCDYTCIYSLGSRILSLDFSPMRILKSTVSSLSLVFNNFVCLLLIFISYSLHETVFSLFIISSTETSLASRHHRLVVWKH